MDKKRLYPSVVDPDVDLAPGEDYRQRQEFEAVAFSPNQRPRMNLESTDTERKASVRWLLNHLDMAPNVNLLADVLRCIILKQPLWNVQAYQTLVSQMRQEKAMTEQRELQTKEWNSFIDKPVVFAMPGYSAELTSDKTDVTITGQPSFAVKVSNGKQSATVQFSPGTLDLWRRRALEEVERFKAAYKTKAEQLIMDPEGIEVTLVRDARETMRPVKIDEDGRMIVEPGIEIGEVLSPITVSLRLLVKKHPQTGPRARLKFP